MYQMSKYAARLAGFFLLFVLGLPGGAEEQFLTGTAASRYSLSRLNVLGSVLMIGAHPDDEDNATIAYVSRGLKAKTGYLSLNRGEGGQNLLGPEQGIMLGVVRTQELLAARRDDGGDQYFTRSIDFGFTNSLEETLTDWGREKILSDVVWVIRQTRPDVIILCFSGTPNDGHGNHQASAVLGQEAWEAAADASKFPEQLKWVQPWRARRVLRRRFAPGQGPGQAAQAVNAPGPGRGRGGAGAANGNAPGPGRRDAFPDQPFITVDTGAFDPVIGRSYREIGVIARSEHRSQGQGQILAYGEGQSQLASVAGDVPKQGVFDGIDISWNRVSGGAKIGELLSQASRQFDDLHPEKTVPALLEARSLIAPLAQKGAEPWARTKLDEIDETIALCAGLRAEAEADAPSYVPGATAKLQLTALNRSPLEIALTGIHLTGWGPDSDAPVTSKQLANNKPEVVPLMIVIPAAQPYSQPFWLREPNNGYTYTISDQTLIGRADILPEVTARFDFALNGMPFSITRQLHYRHADPSKGELIRPVVVKPPVSVDLPLQSLVLPEGEPNEFSVQVRAMTAKQSGEVHLEIPQGWKVEPASVPFDIRDADGAQEVQFRITPPARAQMGLFRVVARVKDTDVAAGVEEIPYSHIPTQTVMQPSEGKLAAVPLKTLAHRVGYVMGSSDKEPEALRQIGCQVDLLTAKDLSSGDLTVYDAIVTGVRAYAVRPDLAANQQRLLDYVKNGGTLVVQYNNNADRRTGAWVAEALDHLGPYPFTFGANDARVTQEDAPVKFLQPDSPLLNTPNKIGPADFEGWIQERGLYFSTKWDEHYQTPLETHDMGDKDQKGALLYTRYGKGAYVFTAFSWFRELPSGVPGAYRIFANLISAGKAGQ
jgi:LmbE family N-acetylglucosaminyl deacetylase